VLQEGYDPQLPNLHHPLLYDLFLYYGCGAEGRKMSVKNLTAQFNLNGYWITLSDSGIEVYDPKLDASGGCSWNVIVRDYAPKLELKRKKRGGK
jgi:hypothetical protein